MAARWAPATHANSAQPLKARSPDLKSLLLLAGWCISVRDVGLDSKKVELNVLVHRAPAPKQRLAKPAYLAKMQEVSKDLSPTWKGKRKTLILGRRSGFALLAHLGFSGEGVVSCCLCSGSTTRITPGDLDSMTCLLPSRIGIPPRCPGYRCPTRSGRRWGHVGTENRRRACSGPWPWPCVSRCNPKIAERSIWMKRDPANCRVLFLLLSSSSPFQL